MQSRRRRHLETRTLTADRAAQWRPREQRKTMGSPNQGDGWDTSLRPRGNSDCRIALSLSQMALSLSRTDSLGLSTSLRTLWQQGGANTQTLPYPRARGGDDPDNPAARRTHGAQASSLIGMSQSRHPHIAITLWRIKLAEIGCRGRRIGDEGGNTWTVVAVGGRTRRRRQRRRWWRRDHRNRRHWIPKSP